MHRRSFKVVLLKSEEDTGTSTNLGIITFDGVSYYLPDDVSKTAVTYSAEYFADAGYSFDYWETTRLVSVSDANANPTTVTVSGDGTLNAIYAAHHDAHLSDEYEPMTIPVNGKNLTVAPTIMCTILENDVFKPFHYPCKSARTTFVDSDWSDSDANYTYVFEDWTDYDWNDIVVSLYATTNGVIDVEICLEDREAAWKNPFSIEITPEGLAVDVHWNSTDYQGDHIVQVNPNDALDIELFAESNLGDTAFITIIPMSTPVASFIYSPLYPQASENVTFNASCSYDPDGWITNYTWNFGDSNTTTVNNPIIKHHYDTFGNYTVTLTVTDNDELTNSISKQVCVRGHPRADFTWSPASPQVGETVTFNASASRPDGGTIINYQWDFGDASPYNFGKFSTHTYTTYGTYEVTLNVTDSEGKLDIEVKTITVRAHPHADFTWSPLQPEENQTVTFDASSSTPNGGTITNYSWNFGDGKSGTGKIVTHVYKTAEAYTVILNITDSEGKWDVQSKQITVHPSAPYPKPVGGHAMPVDKHHFLVPEIDVDPGIGLVFVLSAAMALAIILIRRKNKK